MPVRQQTHVQTSQAVPTNAVHALLAAHGYDLGPDVANGAHGVHTVMALTHFQENHGLAVTGQADPTTFHVLKAVGADVAGPVSPPTAPRRVIQVRTAPGSPVQSVPVAPTGAPTVPAASNLPAPTMGPVGPSGGGGGGDTESTPDIAAPTNEGDPVNLTIGSTGPSVVQVQSILQAGGYDIGPTGVDGKFGPHTADAVMHYQQDHGLTADGVVGPQTAKVMGIILPDANGNYAQTSDGSVPPNATPAPSGGGSGKLLAGLGVAGALAGWYWWKHR